LTDEEFTQMKQHPVIGERICQSLSSTRELLSLIRHHHEKLDGTGYPDGLKDSEIEVHSRIMAIVDVYDALNTDRPYRNALPREEVLEILREETTRGWWDPYLMMKFIQMVENGYVDGDSFKDWSFQYEENRANKLLSLNLPGPHLDKEGLRSPV
jgi:putative two-component system response regulator